MGMIASLREALMPPSRRIPVLTAALATLAAGLLSGCAGSFAPSPVADMHVPIGNIQGTVHGGQAPVTGASIYLYQASTSGYGTAATSLICNSTLMTGTCPSNAFEDGNANFYVQTDSNGNFALSGDYVCTSGAQVYMVAVGGNPGVGPISTTATFLPGSTTLLLSSTTSVAVGQTVSGAGVSGTVTGISGNSITVSQATTAAGLGTTVTFSNVNNTAIVQMAALGQCPASGSMAAQVPYLVINEVTTVAFAYSVGGFATTPYNVSTDSTGTTALANAFANAGNIVNLQWGQAPTVPNGNPNGTNPQAKIYTLANLLATCVNTSSSSSTNCQNLFKYATDRSGNQPSDEAGAIFNIVHNQANNVSNLFNLTSSNNPFNPSLSAQPVDWTLPVIYNNAISTYSTTGTTTIDGGAFNIAADPSGNMWIGDEVKGVVKVTPLGAFSYFDIDATGTKFGEIKGVAIDPTGNIWAADAGNSTITVLNSAGTATLTSSKKVNGLNSPAGIAFDLSGNAYIANDTNPGTMSVLKSNGSQLTGSSYSFVYGNGNNGSTPVNGSAWVEVDSLGDAFTISQGSTYLGALASGANQGNALATPNNIYGYALAIDGSNNLWFMNNSNNSPWNLYEETCSQNTANGNGNGSVKGITCTQQGSAITNNGGMNIPDRITLDGGGTLWVANQNVSTVSAYNITGLTYATGNSWLATRGFSTGATDSCLDAVPDISGNLWTANKDGSVTELLGLASPTKSPKIPGNYQQKP